MFIILQGKVRLSFPTEIDERFNSYWDVYLDILKKYD